jgi:hypothetical protein
LRQKVVKKLKAARDRKKAETSKCGGRKSMLERDPHIVKRAKELAGEKHRSLREIAAELQAEGFVAKSGKPFEPMWPRVCLR